MEHKNFPPKFVFYFNLQIIFKKRPLKFTLPGPFSFHRLNKKSICRTFRWCYPMPMSSFCIVKIKCLTL